MPDDPEFYIYDPSPEQTDENLPVICGGYPGPTLYGTWPTKADAEDFANVTHPDDESGNAVILEAHRP